MTLRLVVLSLLTGWALPVQAEEAAKKEIDGPAVVLKDPLLDKLVGEWVVTGQLAGRPLRQTLVAEWVLNHQFLRLRIESTDAGSPADRYEAHVYLGFDNMSERYVAHWLDLFGGRTSETLGYGTRDGDAIKLVFEYPDGPFRTTFTHDAKTGKWSVTMRQKGADGGWRSFSEQSLARATRETKEKR